MRDKTPDGIEDDEDESIWLAYGQGMPVTWSTPHGFYQAIDTAWPLPLRSFFMTLTFFHETQMSTTKLTTKLIPAVADLSQGVPQSAVLAAVIIN